MFRSFKSHRNKTIIIQCMNESLWEVVKKKEEPTRASDKSFEAISCIVMFPYEPNSPNDVLDIPRCSKVPKLSKISFK